LRIDGGEHAVAIVKRVAKILYELGFGSGGSGPTFFAVRGRSFAFNFVEEGEIRAGHVLDLLRERAHAFEVAGSGKEIILGFGHGLGGGQKLIFGPVKCAANAVGDVVGHFVFPGINGSDENGGKAQEDNDWEFQGLLRGKQSYVRLRTRVSLMHPARIAELLHPFLAAEVVRNPASGISVGEPAAVLSAAQLHLISIYIDILLRWNARVNLTAVRAPEEIVTRHFGESLFAALHLFRFPAQVGKAAPGSLPRAQARGRAERSSAEAITDVTDLGSGAGFPGVPIKIWKPELKLTLIESNQKKATFLREVIRTLTLTDVDVYAGRAENFGGQARVVTLRAVERFELALPTALGLVVPGGRLALLVGRAQRERIQQLVSSMNWSEPVSIPLSANRILLVGNLDPTKQES
jgi:16S rRNA (guanine527-N7)-methyltransferase